MTAPSRMFETMLTIRIVEARLQRLCDEGKAGDLHFSEGQEAISVGVCEALRSTDKIVTHHRTIAHEIARGAELYPLVAEVLGRRTGMNRGRAGEMHLHNEAIGHAFSFQLVGTCLPVAAGLAWASRFYRQTGDIVVVFLGDAAFSNGAVHEGLNIAAVQNCPLLIVVEDNHLAGNIEPKHYYPHGALGTPKWKERFAAYGIDSATIGGNDALEIREFALQAADFVREKTFAYGLVCQTQRLCWHKQGQRDVRTPTEIARLARFDPLLVAQRREGFGGDGVLRLTEDITKRVDAAIEQALADPPAEMVVDE